MSAGAEPDLVLGAEPLAAARADRMFLHRPAPWPRGVPRNGLAAATTSPGS